MLLFPKTLLFKRCYNPHFLVVCHVDVNSRCCRLVVWELEVHNFWNLHQIYYHIRIPRSRHCSWVTLNFQSCHNAHTTSMSCALIQWLISLRASTGNQERLMICCGRLMAPWGTLASELVILDNISKAVNSIGKRLCSPPPLHPKFLRVSKNYQLSKQHQTINTRKEFLKKQSVGTT
jgi:hypothetical protein